MSEDAISLGIYEDVPSELIKKIMRDMLSKSIFRQIPCAFAAVIAGLSALYGRILAIQGDDTRTNIYMLAIAESGEGKSFPRKYMLKLLYEAGLTDFLGSHNFVSAEGLTIELFEKPSHVKYVDEFGDEMIKIKNGKAAHLIGIPPTLTRLYELSNSFYQKGTKAADRGAALTDDAKKKADEQNSVYNPNLSICGTTTPEKMVAYMDKEGFYSGENNRWIVLPGQKETAYIRRIERKKKSLSPSQDIIQDIQGNIKNIYSIETRDFSGYKFHDKITKDQKNHIEVGFEDDNFISDFEEKWFKKRQDDVLGSKVYVRGNENCLKIAMIIAASRCKGDDFEPVVIKNEDLIFAKKIIDNSCEILLDVFEKLSGNTKSTYSKDVDSITSFFKKKAELGATNREFTNSRNYIPAATRMKIVEDLIEGEQVVQIGNRIYWKENAPKIEDVPFHNFLERTVKHIT